MGITVSLGVEWMLNENVRIIAEYGFSIIQGKLLNETHDKYRWDDHIRIREYKSDFSEIKPRDINFGLAFYF